MPRSSAWLLLCSVVAMVANACILPSDGRPRRSVENYPPEIDFLSLDPRPEFSLDVPRNGNCRFNLRARISDRDDSVVRIRWIADNERSIVVPLDEDDDVNLPPGSRPERSISVDTRELTAPLEGTQHSITLFVTDSEAPWDATFEELRDGEKLDGGRLQIQGDGGLSDGTVTWTMWSIFFGVGACEER